MRYDFVVRCCAFVDGCDEDDDGYGERDVEFELPSREDAIAEAVRYTAEAGWPWYVDWVFEYGADGGQTASVPTGDYLLSDAGGHAIRELNPDPSAYVWDEER